ncbi:hypothetical protein ON010_g5716 [Phytophthora cinnamomi]|nr:hypothetical protein ON010_g5716 [Phytophthora cinnamomi]
MSRTRMLVLLEAVDAQQRQLAALRVGVRVVHQVHVHELLHLHAGHDHVLHHVREEGGHVLALGDAGQQRLHGLELLRVARHAQLVVQQLADAVQVHALLEEVRVARDALHAHRHRHGRRRGRETPRDL